MNTKNTSLWLTAIGLISAWVVSTSSGQCFRAPDGSGPQTAVMRPAKAAMVEAETELPYYGYRYYNTSTGRWLSRDPLGDEPSERLMVQMHSKRPPQYIVVFSTMVITDVVNPYAFVLNLPLTTIDLYGLKPCSSCLIAGAQSLAAQLGLQYIGQTREDGRERGGVICCDECSQTVYAANVVVAPPERPGTLPIINSKCNQGDKQIADWHTHPNMDTQLGHPDQYSPDWVREHYYCTQDHCSYHSYMTNTGNETSDLDCNKEETIVDTGD